MKKKNLNNNNNNNNNEFVVIIAMLGGGFGIATPYSVDILLVAKNWKCHGGIVGTVGVITGMTTTISNHNYWQSWNARSTLIQSVVLKCQEHIKVPPLCSLC